jgi:LacI family transcriptional regulator, trehalose operon repressor
LLIVFIIDIFSNNLTIKNIAKLCEVIKSTALRVINYDPIMRGTNRNQVIAIVEQYQFTYSKPAMTIGSYSDKVIGIIDACLN